jgi:hypothetical protein
MRMVSAVNHDSVAARGVSIACRRDPPLNQPRRLLEICVQAVRRRWFEMRAILEDKQLEDLAIKGESLFAGLALCACGTDPLFVPVNRLG